jgi:hypothetical protein
MGKTHFTEIEIRSGEALTIADGATVTVAGTDITDALASLTEGGAVIEDEAITTAKLAADAVDGTKLADDAVDSEHIADGAIDTAHLSADCVTAANLADDSVVTANIVDANVTEAKLASAVVTKLDAAVTASELAADASSDAATAVAAVAAKASLTGTETLTNKTLTTPIIASLYQDAGKTKLMTVPDTASDTLAAIAATQTLTNKTLTAPKIATGGSINDAGGDEYLKFVEATTPVTYLQITTGDTGVAPSLKGAGETNTDLLLAGSGTGKITLADGADNTKDIKIDLSGATTDKTVTIASSQTDDRTITLPDATTTLVGTDAAQTLSGKTLTAPKIVTTGYIADAGGDEYLVFTEATTPVTHVGIASGNTGVAPQVRGAGETNTDLKIAGTGTGNVIVADGADLTKELSFELSGATTDKTTTIAASQTDDRVITLPDATTTLVGTDVTQTLTGKTLTAPVMTSPDITFSAVAHDYAGGHADWELSAAEAKNLILTTTNVDTAAAIIAPATANKVYIVYNGSGETLTIKATGQTGVEIATLKTAIVRCNGTDYVRVTTDA